MNVAKLLMWLLATSTTLTVAAEANSSTPVTVCDGRTRRAAPEMDNKAQLTPEEAELVTTVLLPQATKALIGVHGKPDSFRVTRALPGSFTENGAKQKALFYHYSGSDPVAIYGVAILQGTKLIANYVYEGGAASDVLVVPAVGTDGRNSLAVETWSMHQGFRHGGVTLIKIGEKENQSFGYFEIKDEDLNANRFISYNITARPSETPKFQSTKYKKIGRAWKQIGTSMPAKPLDASCDFIRAN